MFHSEFKASRVIEHKTVKAVIAGRPDIQIYFLQNIALNPESKKYSVFATENEAQKISEGERHGVSTGTFHVLGNTQTETDSKAVADWAFKNLQIWVMEYIQSETRPDLFLQFIYKDIKSETIDFDFLVNNSIMLEAVEEQFKELFSNVFNKSKIEKLDIKNKRAIVDGVSIILGASN